MKINLKKMDSLVYNFRYLPQKPLPGGDCRGIVKS